jgi:toxin LF subunit
MADDPNQPQDPSLLERAESWTAQKADRNRDTLSEDDKLKWDITVGFLKGVYGFGKSAISGLLDIAIFAAKAGCLDPPTWRKIGETIISIVKFSAIYGLGTPEQKLAQQVQVAMWADALFTAAKEKLTNDWNKAKKDGKENELVMEWGTRGVLEVASLFVGIGEVEGAEAASDLSKVGNVLDKAKVACPLEDAAKVARLAEIEKAAALAKAAVRAKALEKSGMVTEHMEAISKVAEERNEVLLFQEVNPNAAERISEGCSPKPMRIKGKSAETGPARGYIPRNQALSKAADHGPEEVAKYQKAVDEAIERGHAKIVTLEDGTQVLADPYTGMPYTSDYDMLTVGREGETSLPFATEDQGVMVAEDEGTMNAVNDAVDNPGGDVVQHATAGTSPVPQPVNYPITAFTPDGGIQLIENPEQLQNFVTDMQSQGYNFNLDPSWGIK